MSPDLLELTRNYFIGSTLRQISTAFQESESSVSTALRRAAPVVLTALLARTQQPGGTNDVFARVYRVHRRNPLANFDGLLSEVTAPEGPTPEFDGSLPGPSPRLLRAALGQRYASTVEGISQHAGLSPDTVGELLNLTTVVELALLGRYAAEHTLDARGLASYLATQPAPAEEELATMPAEPAARSGLLASGQAPPATQPIPAAPVSVAPPPVAPPTPVAALPPPVPVAAPLQPQPAPLPEAAPALSPAATPPRRWQWVLALLLLVVLAIAAAQLYFLRETGKPALPSATPGAGRGGAAAPAPADRPEVAGRTPPTYIPGRTTLLMHGRPSMRVSNNSTEARLYSFLHDPARTVSLDKTQGWILLDQVYFSPGTTTLTPEALVQLRKLAIILKAFPRAIIKLGGYTDDRASADQNLVISADCANAVRKVLLTHSIAPTRVSAEGYGQAPTRTAPPAGHSQSRRVYVRVVKKY